MSEPEARQSISCSRIAYGHGGHGLVTPVSAHGRGQSIGRTTSRIRRLASTFVRFNRDQRGVFLVIFALLALVLIATSGAVVDFTRMQRARTIAQVALDAAALALQSTINDVGVTAATLKPKAQMLLTERLADDSVTATVDSATPDRTAGKLTISAHIEVPTYFVALVGVSTIRANLLSEVTRSSSDLEVSVSLDVTGSMSGSKIDDLIDATNTLIDLVVKDVQTPTYSKMAIVPWSSAVNVGGIIADAVRGPVAPGAAIVSATWMSGASKTITAVNRASPARVTTSAAHGFSVGDYVYISGVSGMTNLNNNIYRVSTVPSTTRVTLQTTTGSNVDSRTWTRFSTGGSPRITKCLNSACQVRLTTSGAHGLSTGETVYISGAAGMSDLNDTHVGAVGSVPTTSSFFLTSLDSDNVLYTPHSSGTGTSYCAVPGCTYYYFANADGGHNLYQINTCATDRTSATYTDTPPSTAPLGRNYRSGGADCLEQVVAPLTASKATLHAIANDLVAAGSTSGHLGLAWGWYVIAPDFAYLWPTVSRPRAYGSANLVKAIVFMTDGDFNTPYCNGVVASDASPGSGSTSSRINCASPNGSSRSQAEMLCDSIKAPSNDIILYTVGFDLAGNTAALSMLEECATTPDHFFQADSGTDLETAFEAIAQSLSELRISK